MRALFLFLALMLGLAACAERGMIRAVLPPPPGAEASVEEIFVVTTRAPLPAPPFFSAKRSERAHFAQFQVSVPRNRELGEINWRRDGPARPDRHFLTVGHESIDSTAEMERHLRQRLAAISPENREVVLFVHGFNTNFPEALYRMAQIQTDFAVPGQPVLFSWPSNAQTQGYLYDRDSTLIARNALEETLRRLDRISGGRVTLIGFSMGAFLAVETLRQVGRSSDPSLLGRLRGVVLISPDIDVQLFRASAPEIRPFPDPFLILASRQDRALGLAALITGQKSRLGSIESLQGLEDLGVTLIDVTAFNSEAVSSHTVGLTSPSLIRILRSARALEVATRRRETGRPVRRSVALSIEEIQRRVLSSGR